jgi:hypothetical protein
MPIYQLLERGAFQPEDITVMGNVFEDVLKTLRLVDRKDPVAELVAYRIIGLVQAGEHDPVRLKQLTLEALRGRPSSV